MLKAGYQKRTQDRTLWNPNSYAAEVETIVFKYY